MGLMVVEQTDPNHLIMVTGDGPFGRAWFDCTCGIARTFGSKGAANLSALAHYREVYGHEAVVA
jgi:hypothetical protein